MKKQKILIAKYDSDSSGLFTDNLIYLEQNNESLENGKANEVPIQKFLKDGWVVKNGWPMGGGNIAFGENIIGITATPFISMILLEREEP